MYYYENYIAQIDIFSYMVFKREDLGEHEEQ